MHKKFKKSNIIFYCVTFHSLLQTKARYLMFYFCKEYLIFKYIIKWTTQWLSSSFQCTWMWTFSFKEIINMNLNELILNTFKVQFLSELSKHCLADTKQFYILRNIGSFPVKTTTEIICYFLFLTRWIISFD